MITHTELCRSVGPLHFLILYEVFRRPNIYLEVYMETSGLSTMIFIFRDQFPYLHVIIYCHLDGLRIACLTSHNLFCFSCVVFVISISLQGMSPYPRCHNQHLITVCGHLNQVPSLKIKIISLQTATCKCLYLHYYLCIVVVFGSHASFFLVLFCASAEEKSIVAAGEPIHSLGQADYSEHNSNLDTADTQGLTLTCSCLNL